VILSNVGKLTGTEKQVERQLWTTVKVEINKYSCKTRITNPAITHNFLRAIGYLKPIKDHASSVKILIHPTRFGSL
jgi:hypothetical protein